MRRLAWLLFVLGAAASCTEEATAPGVCPNFCPGGRTGIKDTIFTDVVQRDSSYRGYVPPHAAEGLAAASLPQVDSRVFFVLPHNLSPTVPTSSTDTTSVPIAVDSSLFRVSILRRDTSATNLTLRVYRLPITTDSTSTFASTDPDFTASPIDSVNVSALLARAPIIDTVTADSVRRRIFGNDTTRTDSAGHVLTVADSGRTLTLFFHFDTLQAPFVPTDSGQLAFGFRVSADSFPSITLASLQATRSPLMMWSFHHTIHDTTGVKPDSTIYGSALRSPQFNSFVFNPPNAPLDSNLAVGGAPSARTLVRFKLPKFLHDSIDVVRATAIFVPVTPAVGAPSDSFSMRVYPILADFGGKSPPSSAFSVSHSIHPGAADTVRIEVTDLVRAWAQDTTAVTAFFMAQVPEAASFAEIRFYSSRAAAFRPALHITYVTRFPFGTP
jgi:hypothetical protein